MIRLYRLLTQSTGGTGRPLALCDSHKARLVVPAGVVVRLVEDKTNQQCEKCQMPKRRKHHRITVTTT